MHQSYYFPQKDKFQEYRKKKKLNSWVDSIGLQFWRIEILSTMSHPQKLERRITEQLATLLTLAGEKVAGLRRWPIRSVIRISPRRTPRSCRSLKICNGRRFQGIFVSGLSWRVSVYLVVSSIIAVYFEKVQKTTEQHEGNRPHSSWPVR